VTGQGLVRVENTAQLRAVRMLLGRMRDTAAGLASIGHDADAAALAAETDALAAVRLLVPVDCVLCDRWFWAGMDAEGPPPLRVGPGVCAACNAPRGRGRKVSMVIVIEDPA